MMIPAFAQGCVCGAGPAPGGSSGFCEPRSDVTLTVMLPLPVSGWCTK
jgi:hypothetical protein